MLSQITLIKEEMHQISYSLRVVIKLSKMILTYFVILFLLLFYGCP